MTSNKHRREEDEEDDSSSKRFKVDDGSQLIRQPCSDPDAASTARMEQLAAARDAACDALRTWLLCRLVTDAKLLEKLADMRKGFYPDILWIAENGRRDEFELGYSSIKVAEKKLELAEDFNREFLQWVVGLVHSPGVKCKHVYDVVQFCCCSVEDSHDPSYEPRDDFQDCLACRNPLTSDAKHAYDFRLSVHGTFSVTVNQQIKIEDDIAFSSHNTDASGYPVSILGIRRLCDTCLGELWAHCKAQEKKFQDVLFDIAEAVQDTIKKLPGVIVFIIAGYSREIFIPDCLLCRGLL